MKKIKIGWIVFLICCLNGLVSAQKHPFPTTFKPPYGFVPTTVDMAWVKSEYDKWLKGALTTCSNGGLFITTDGGYKVEAIGFAAFIFAYMGDSARFAATYNFYKANLTTSAGGMMGWQGGCGGPSASGGATDGDVDVALGLIVASWQWPNAGYLEKAKAVITVLKKMVVNCKRAKGDSVKCLTMGYNWGGCSQTDISYYNPAGFREYAKVIGNTEDSLMWVKLADDTYTILNASANATSGLVPDRQNVDGAANGGYSSFGEDACRTPWRITLDYLWNGNEKAKEWCIKVSNHAKSVGIKNIGRSGGTGSAHESKFVGGFCIAAMANSQEMVDEFAAEMKNLNDQYNWFTKVLKFCYLITLTGNQWREDLFNPIKVSTNQNYPAKIPAQILCKRTGNREFSVSGLNQGNKITLTDFSGKSLYQTTAAGSNVSIDISRINRGCAVLTISDNNRIVKSDIISNF
jgi:endo-1,4-beta-D-glucanase Y